MRGACEVDQRPTNTKEDKSQLSGVVLNALDRTASTKELAREACQSRTQIHRLFRAVVEQNGPDGPEHRDFQKHALGDAITSYFKVRISDS
jgi:AraC-like DNA-binding protein